MSEPQPAEKPHRRGPRRETVAAALLSGVGVLFAALNSQSVKVDLIVTTTHAPLIVVIAMCLLLGVGGTVLATHGRRR
jgi:uncharacterized integral membrane protein